MTKIKVCGLKRQEDINYVNILKPDYVGFVFAESKRKVSVNECKELREKIDKNIKVVGVFVNEDIHNLKYISDFVGLDIIQLHGDEDDKYIDKLKELNVWKAIRVKDHKSINDIEKYNVQGILLDTFSKKMYGGSGKIFDWNIVKELSHKRNIILAGGLSIENVQEGISIVNPNIVDVSSGVETEGVKDFEKIKKFIEKVRSL
ncbi:N-(5'-phosphoribosyl)anthranilate isomerase TrpF [Gottschalkia purinilytica]|uniref:N-(5'-phosphoribosyl)anthranilate isomerase n=1 Tax=Gottschalkia purinilytica TaxID=1503 RepID=A0A0L0WA09_GOTPU|nr:phosphoribosylanthranilate isomerase [Gottschalkia purinilytica]KNF08135.1 N-(5'-phosphoribosyl)anthranilate isomerase TrpF [Gottschalkia purinilytica]